jgi:hypothetical protein
LALWEVPPQIFKKFRLSLPEGLMEKHDSGVPCPVYGCPSIDPSFKRVTE